MSIIRFNDADVSINDGELTDYGNGILLTATGNTARSGA